VKFDQTIYFNSVRESLFSGHMTQSQVDGQKAILEGWSAKKGGDDPRWLAYFLATAYHETSQAMQPVEEYKGSSQPYGQPDPVTGQCYYGRGFVQLTHKENYQRADDELGCTSVQHPEEQLDAHISGATGYRGMTEGWFRSPNKFEMYFNETTEDPYGAREIINGDKKTVPSWSGGVSIGNLIAGYFYDFLTALVESAQGEPTPGKESKISISAREISSIEVDGVKWLPEKGS